MAATGRTSHAGILALDRARTINRLCGTDIGPWDVEQMNDEWLDLFEGMASELEEIKAQMANVERKRMDFMQAHATYRKH